ncbi:hypothetical protein LTV02_24215 [Nocardia yamanashiensis]|uniref:hypothetical protein n=1 Tax=Nocardia yamanashiensis TaxID=209247 RepID=UPI001E536A1F|nr:hypothetical protein [Nocardia yamanashiensis]UGT39190.1 hypothetical protein LTV02_24215 [Nocardia yamanashiensis]
MSQQKDSELGENPERPAETTAPASEPAAAAPDAQAPAEPEPPSPQQSSDEVATEPVAAAPGKKERAERPAPQPGAVDPSVKQAVTIGAIAVAVVAAVAAAWFGGTWIVGGLMHDRPRAQARDAALTDARQAAINLMTFDPNNVDGSLQNMISSTTGQLHDEQTKDLESLKQQVTEAKTNMQSTVEGATLTALNSELDHASAYVVLRINRSWPGGQPAAFRQSWSLDMVKVGDVWKAEKAQNLGNPVQLDSGALQQNGAPATPAPSTTAAPAPGN